MAVPSKYYVAQNITIINTALVFVLPMHLHGIAWVVLRALMAPAPSDANNPLPALVYWCQAPNMPST